MTSKETKSLQISLHTSLAALSLHKDLGIRDDASSTTSSISTFSSVSSRDSPPFDISDGIPLHLAHWGQFEATPVASADDGRIKAAKIFNFFIAAGREFGLGETP